MKFNFRPTSAGEMQAQHSFDINSANGKGYVLQISQSGEPGSSEVSNSVNYNSKGAHITGLESGKTYHVLAVYTQDGYVVARTEVGAV